MLRVTYFTDSGTTISMYLAHLTRAQTQGSIHTFTSQQLCGGARTARNLRAFAWLHLYAVDLRTDRNIGYRQCVACTYRCIAARLKHIPRFDTFRCNDVTLDTILVNQQCDVCATVWIVLNAFNTSRDTIFVTLEIDNTITLLMATADVTSADTTGIVTATRLTLTFSQ